MSDVAAASVASGQNEAEPPSAVSAAVSGKPDPVKGDVPRDSEPSTVTNGPAGQPLHADPTDMKESEETCNVERLDESVERDLEIVDSPAAAENPALDAKASPDEQQTSNEPSPSADGLASAEEPLPNEDLTADDEQMEDQKAHDGAMDTEESDSVRNTSEVNEESDGDDPFAGLDDVATMDLYDLANYTFGKKNEESKARAMQELSRPQIAEALEESYDERGMRRSVGAVILVHSHNFPHILLLQRSDGKGEFALPGGRLRPGESDEEGLQRKLMSKLKPSKSSSEDEEEQQLDVGEKLCTWHAIDFSRRYYPYVPAHVTKPKEELHVYTVSLPRTFMFAVPKNLQLVAVPLFELFNNSATYGDVISAIPALLSRYHINSC